MSLSQQWLEASCSGKVTTSWSHTVSYTTAKTFGVKTLRHSTPSAFCARRACLEVQASGRSEADNIYVPAAFLRNKPSSRSWLSHCRGSMSDLTRIRVWAKQEGHRRIACSASQGLTNLSRDSALWHRLLETGWYCGSSLALRQWRSRWHGPST